MLVVHAAFPIRADRRDEALEMVDELIDASNEEDGIIDYRATTDIQDENTIRFFEQYEDEEAFISHTQTDHFQELEAALPDLLAGEPEILRFDVSEATELDL